ncbi:MAG: KH domain-containing protein [Acidimicrobiales bacterium]
MPDDLFAQPEFAAGDDDAQLNDDDGDDDDEDEEEGAEVSAEVSEPDGHDEESPPGAAGPDLVRGAAAKAVLIHVTSALVDDPDAVVVDVSEGRSGLRFSVRVAPGDMGRVIGRRGRTVQAIRTLVRAAAAGEGLDASVAVDD